MMSHSYGFDLIDGRQVPQTVISTDHEITGTHKGTVHVEGGQLTLTGAINGTLSVQRGAIALIQGKQQGTVSVEAGAEVIVTGAISGSASVQQGGRLVVERGARLAGTLSNNGTVIIRGTFGGAKTGSGEFRVEGDGKVKQPIIRNGAHFYEWGASE
jgi:cytoskeletal protein CcmA (bactofilin family)